MLIRLALRVQREQAELVLAELLELAPGGVEESEQGDVVEYAVYGAPGELPDLPDLRAAAGAALVEVTTSEVPDDWNERWKAFHQPVRIGALLVRPPWAPPRAGLLDVVIDPAQAFGTGAHPTTRLCLELLLELEPAGALVDVGCGSGVLAIAAAKLGHAPVTAVDVDPAAVQATLDNAAANDVLLEARLVDAARESLPAADAAVANIALAAVAGILRTLHVKVAVTSGYLARDSLQPFGYRRAARRTEGEWAADWWEPE